MVQFEKYCDKCGMPSKQLVNVDGKRLCPKCRGVHVEEDEEQTRREQRRKLWSDAR
jgi:uncharacterized Zn finger protein (UPF0148 family)